MGALPAATSDLKTLKWMPGDSIAIDGRVVKRAAKQIVGIIDILNRTRFGTTSRGIPLYIMYPLDVSYPPFLLALKTKPDTNVLAIATYEHWDGIWPRAGLVKLLGPVGHLDSELEAMRQTLVSGSSGALDDGLRPDFSKHTLADWDVVLHIDPPGCKDVDDVLCWKWKGPQYVTFSIGIADVGSWVAEGTDLDTTACMRGATLYDDGVAIVPMFPTWLSESCASLRCDGEMRPAVCLTFDLERVDDVWRMTSPGRFELHRLRVTESYTYDSIHDHAERATEVRAFVSAVWGTHLGMDSHEWVERAMIVYNRTVGEELQLAGIGLLRAHEGVTHEQYARLAVETGCPELQWLGSAAGRYVRPTDNTGHAGLSLACYTHASSPLRRYVDLYNQRWIHALRFGGPVPAAAAGSMFAEFMNSRAKRIRQLERDIYFLQRVLGGTHDGLCSGVSGFLLSKSSDEDGVERWRAYVPEWKRVVPCVLARDLAEAETEPATSGMKVIVRVYFDVRQANAAQRFIYQAAVSILPHAAAAPVAADQNKPHDEFN